MNQKVLIGWSEQDITPEKPVMLRGQFYPRISTGVQSRISVTAMAVEAGMEQMVLCSCDLSMVSTELVHGVRKNLVNRIKDLDVSKIVIAATHTHTAPEFEGPSKKDLHAALDFIPPEKQPITEVVDGVLTPQEYEAFLILKISRAVEDAWSGRRAACFKSEFGRAVVGHCRRVTYMDGSAQMYGDSGVEIFDCLEGGSDSGIELLYTFDSEKKLTGIVINIACPSQIVEHKHFVSADYWGEVRKALRARFGERLYILAQCSAAGDQSPRDMIRSRTKCNEDSEGLGKRGVEPSMNDIQGIMEIGKRISTVVTERYEFAKAAPQDSAVLIHRVETLELPFRMVSESEYVQAREQIIQYIAVSGKERFDYNDMAAMHTWAGSVRRYELQKSCKTFSVELHAIKFGDISFATSPFELFLDYGLRIKARSPANQTFLIQLACGCYGYLPTEKAERGGHYSAVIASGNTGHEGGNLLVERTLKLFNTFWGE